MNNEQYRIAFINIHGLKKEKCKKIIKFMNNNKIDILGICETWCEVWPSDLPDYLKAICIREQSKNFFGRQMKGIIVLCRNTLKIEHDNNDNNLNRAILSNEKIILIFYYRENLDKLTSVIPEKYLEESKTKKLILMGDLNCKVNDNKMNNLEELCLPYCISCIENKKSTYFSGKINTAPDKIFTNFEANMIVAEYDKKISDHCFIFTEIFFNKPLNNNFRLLVPRKPETKEKCMFKIEEYLKKEKIENDINSMNSLLIKAIVSATKINGKRILKNKKIIPNISGSKKGYFNGLNKNTERKKLEKLIHEFVLDPEINYKKNNLKNIRKQKNDFEKININELMDTIKILPMNKSPGSSGIRNEHIQCLGTNGIRLILDLFNKILEKRRIPKQWKRIMLKPIPKKDNTFRPIALTEHVRKCFELLLIKRLNLKFNEQQGGFVKNIGTTQHSLILDSKLKCANGKLKTISLDIKKAYDSVDRQLVYEKLRKQFNVEPYLIEILFSLNEENICILKNEEFYARKELKIGLPQGSILSPMLFNAFINDLLIEIGSEYKDNILIYADDIIIFHEQEEKLKILLSRIEAHSYKNHYKLNPLKCYHMGQEDFTHYIYNSEIQNTNIIKYMGYIFNKKGSDINGNINEMKTKMIRINRIINNEIMKKNMMPKEILMSYKIFARPYIDYFSRLIGYSKTFLNQAEIIQKKALKYLLQMPMDLPTEFLYALIPIEQVEYRVDMLNFTLNNSMKNLPENYLFKRIYNEEKTKAIKRMKNIENELLRLESKSKFKKIIIYNNKKKFFTEKYRFNDLKIEDLKNLISKFYETKP
ncbi:RNA-directed DNA polymerase [Cetobacterium sp.]|uniref:RNA-directed DNA polymerase n=1 Tax=Cetobacterium sp. TaxID=2071632 RepID=UPI003F4040F2